jgi:hypothetical protein
LLREVHHDTADLGYTHHTGHIVLRKHPFERDSIGAFTVKQSLDSRTDAMETFRS